MSRSPDSFEDALAIIRSYRIDSSVAESRDWRLVDECLHAYAEPWQLIQGLAGLCRILMGLVDVDPGTTPADRLLDIAYESAIQVANRKRDQF